MTGGFEPLDVFIVAGEESGDSLGAGLMAELKTLHAGEVRFRGVGGARMQAHGLAELFPMEDITAMGFAQVIGGLPRILRRMRQVTEAILARPPDILVMVDAPDFTHRVARRVRARLPTLPIVKYVAPTVWVWRPGRAKAMTPDFDRVLAVLPFEPQAMHELGGPPTTYVGHPLLGELGRLRPNAEEADRREASPPVLLVLPGSRRAELARLGAPFGEVLGRLRQRAPELEVVLPTLPRRLAQVEQLVASWPAKPRIVVGDEEKRAAFRVARAALAASGTVTLELALAGIPTVAAYKVPWLEGRILPYVLRVKTAILPNLVLGEAAVPEYLQWHIDPLAMAAQLARLIEGGPERQAQLAAFARLDVVMGEGDAPPSRRAAGVVLETLAARRRAM
ncbi:lipid-A-disaccharide synthase [Ancylobacter dichloromethanicus]|uniref:Lipid-A-disaccharide synthase n=1 Tax=Ancylobacter dichloromethanicus TaxID=518825 RepID=A0A9W6J6M4_9HYPH|nr:lipid-A-disaccharide synthase [Ancylobacter dichloromethanicus]MBS7554211.1 lipid-A-disaccharide synthase [Ancylobacter dichloromethanicus]GLK71332.1 lipid-A-disaccharide synthase [Ancylobacter dichloromethanicus]